MSRRRPLLIGLIGLVVIAVAIATTLTVTLGRPSQVDRATAVPAGLSVPLGLSPSERQVWCVHRQAQGTTGLSADAIAWLQTCARVFYAQQGASGGSPSPSTTARPSPSSSSAKPTPGTSTRKGSGGCPVAGRDVPGGADPWGGCFPGPGNTGVPAGAKLKAYTGPCTITKAGTVLDHVHVVGKSGSGSICSTLTIKATSVTIRDSLLTDVDVNNGDSSGDSGSFTIVDSTVTNGARDQCACVGYHDFTALRVNVVGGNRSMYCISHCTIEDSWLHGQVLEGAQHGSGLRVEEFTTATHNSFACSYAIAHDSTTLGCSAPQNGYADFAAIKNNTMRNNLYVSSNQGAGSDQPGKPNASYCSYGGDTAGKDHSGDAGNGTHMQFISNVFQRGVNGGCGYYGPVTAFNPGLAGNVWSGNTFDDGKAIPVCSTPASTCADR